MFTVKLMPMWKRICAVESLTALTYVGVWFSVMYPRYMWVWGPTSVVMLVCDVGGIFGTPLTRADWVVVWHASSGKGVMVGMSTSAVEGRTCCVMRGTMWPRPTCSTDTFKRHLKTWLFNRAYDWHWDYYYYNYFINVFIIVVIIFVIIIVVIVAIITIWCYAPSVFTCRPIVWGTLSVLLQFVLWIGPEGRSENRRSLSGNWRYPL